MDYARDESGASEHVLRKWRIVGLFWIVQALFVAGFVPLWITQGETVNGKDGQPLGTVPGARLLALFTSAEVWSVIASSILVLMALQSILVWPVRRPRSRADRGWPLRLSIGAAAFLGMAMAAALYAGLITFFEVTSSGSEGLSRMLALGFWSWLAISYVGGSVLMHRFCTRRLNAGLRHEDVLGRIAATLFLGTVVEAVAILPLDIMFRRKQDCYCWAGTFWAYAALVGIGLVTVGPAALLPALSRRRKRWYASHCDCCGYDMRGAIGAGRTIDRCPECGAGWRRDEREAPVPTKEQSQDSSARAEGS